MARIAADLADHVFPMLPVWQWALSVSKRLRLISGARAEPKPVSALRHSFLRVIEAHRRETNGAADLAHPRLAAASFIHRFGSS
jgi:hypothetical protein